MIQLSLGVFFTNLYLVELNLSIVLLCEVGKFAEVKAIVVVKIVDFPALNCLS